MHITIEQKASDRRIKSFQKFCDFRRIHEKCTIIFPNRSSSIDVAMETLPRSDSLLNAVRNSENSLRCRWVSENGFIGPDVI